jgi:hypothetical protein
MSEFDKDKAQLLAALDLAVRLDDQGQKRPQEERTQLMAAVRSLMDFGETVKTSRGEATGAIFASLRSKTAAALGDIKDELAKAEIKELIEQLYPDLFKELERSE